MTSPVHLRARLRAIGFSGLTRREKQLLFAAQVFLPERRAPLLTASVSSLAKCASLRRRTIQETLASLRALEVLVPEGTQTFGETTRYQVHLDRLPGGSARKPARPVRPPLRSRCAQASTYRPERNCWCWRGAAELGRRRSAATACDRFRCKGHPSRNTVLGSRTHRGCGPPRKGKGRARKGQGPGGALRHHSACGECGRRQAVRRTAPPPEAPLASQRGPHDVHATECLPGTACRSPAGRVATPRAQVRL
jgi:hypothetical protein